MKVVVVGVTSDEKSELSTAAAVELADSEYHFGHTAEG